MNSINLIGRWAADVELKYTTGGKAVATARLAVKDGDTAHFFPVVIWEKQAESVANYAGSKGRQVGVNGKLTTRSYETKEGQKRTVIEVVANRVDFLGDAQQGGASPRPPGMGSELSFDDDVPFDM